MYQSTPSPSRPAVTWSSQPAAAHPAISSLSTGRQIARIAAEHAGFPLAAVNDLGDAMTNAHLFKYDSTYGRFAGAVEQHGNRLHINGAAVEMLQEPSPGEIRWGDLGVEFVYEC